MIADFGLLIAEIQNEEIEELKKSLNYYGFFVLLLALPALVRLLGGMLDNG